MIFGRFYYNLDGIVIVVKIHEDSVADRCNWQIYDFNTIFRSGIGFYR